MFKKLVNKKRLNNEKGLTLIELLAVIVILAIIAAIAIPAIGNIIDNSRGKALKADVVNVMNAANIYFTDNPEKAAVDMTELHTSGYLESIGKLKEANVTHKAGGNIISANGKNGSVEIDVDGATLNDVNAHSGKPKDKKVTIRPKTNEGAEG